MIGRLNFLFIGLLLLVKVAVAAPTEATPLYLSFEQRLAVTYALQSYGESKEHKDAIIKRAQNYFQSLSQKEVKTVAVKNFKEFLAAFRGDWPNTENIATDLEIIEKRGVAPLAVYVSESPRVQKQIDEYIQWQEDKVASLIKESLPTEQKQALKEASFADAMVLMMSLAGTTEGKDAVMNDVESFLDMKMKELDRVGQTMANSGFAAQKDATMKIFMQTLFNEYFSRLSLESKRLIVSSYLGGDLNIGDIKKFELMVQNSGPQLQKLLQVVARQADLSPELLEVFRGLENSVRPVSWVQVEEIIKKEKSNFDFRYFERKPLGVGTMAQVHRAKIYYGNKMHDVVVRFIKPGIEKRVAEDQRILTEVAKILDVNPEFRKTGAPKLGPVIEDITQTVVAELDQPDTTARQKMAKPRYERTVLSKFAGYKTYIEFHVPAIYESKSPSQLMVQELVIGKKLDKEASTYVESIPGLKKNVIEEMARIWSQEVMFGSGFYHSDLHQGNFMIQVTDEKVNVNILDYGMGGVLSSELQRLVMVLGAGVELKDPKLITRAFWSMSQQDKNSVDQSSFANLVKERLSRIQKGQEANITLEGWTAWAMDAGLRLPYEFISLNRGMVIVNKLLADSGSSLTVTKLMKDLAVVHPKLVLKRMVLEEKVSYKDLLKLGWIELDEKFRTPKKPVMKTPVCESVFL